MTRFSHTLHMLHSVSSVDIVSFVSFTEFRQNQTSLENSCVQKNAIQVIIIFYIIEINLHVHPLFVKL